MPQMKNSRLPDDWLARTVAANPFVKLPDGGFRSPPVRLTFPHLMKPATNKGDDGQEKQQFEVTALLPPGADQSLMSVVWPEIYQIFRTKFPQNIGQDGNPFGLHIPWRDQGEKQQYAGYTPGLKSLRMISNFKPQVVDTTMNPIVDENRVYPGVWAMLTFNMFDFNTKKKGVSLGLQSVMLVADDEKLGGGAPDVKTQFDGLNITPHFDANAAFQGAQPPGAVLPPAAPVASPPAPGYGAPPPAPGFSPPPPAPGFSPPPAPGFGAPPPAPAPAAPSLASLGLE